MTPRADPETGQALFLDLPVAGGGPGTGRIVGYALLTTVLYIVSGYAGLRLAFIGESVTLFWPPAGIAFAALWLGGRGLLPAVALGALVVNLITGLPAGFALAVAVGNTLSAFAAVTVVRWLIRRRPDAGELWRVLWFILAAVLGCTILSATIGTAAVELSGISNSPPPAVWFVWWMGDAMGMLIVAPPALLWKRIVGAHYRMRDLRDAIGFAAAGAAIIAGLWIIDQPLWAVELCKLFTLLLSLWAGARFGLNGPSMMALLMACGAVAVTVSGVGPFARGSFYDRFALVHSYLFAEAIAGMLLAAAIADLRRVSIRERRALELAELAASSRIQLMTMISHDLRTPLSGMTGVLQLLDREPLPPAQHRLVELGLRAGRTVTALVTDLLDIARLQRGDIVLTLAPFDPRQSLGDILDFHRYDAADKALGLTLELDPAIPPTLLGDRVRFEQLIGNLIANAIAYTGSGGVTVTARWQDRLVIGVADTGPGITPQATPHIFDAFMRLDNAASASAAAGLGLGLHICRRLAGLMHGTIDYRPGVTGGSCFTIELPLPLAPDVAGTAPPLALPDSAQRVLLVEDDPIASEIGAALLTSHGHQVTLIDDANDAAAQVASATIDLVLMDLQIGGDARAGLTALQAIRSLAPPANAVPVVALTGDAVPANHARYRAAGFDAVLVKPLMLTGGLAAAIAQASGDAA